MRLLIETVRYSPAWKRRGGEPFTINNNRVIIPYHKVRGTFTFQRCGMRS